MSNDKVAATFHGSDKSDEAEVERLMAILDRVRAVIANDWVWSDGADCRIVEVPDLQAALDGPGGDR